MNESEDLRASSTHLLAAIHPNRSLVLAVCLFVCLTICDCEFERRLVVRRVGGVQERQQRRQNRGRVGLEATNLEQEEPIRQKGSEEEGRKGVGERGVDLKCLAHASAACPSPARFSVF